MSLRTKLARNRIAVGLTSSYAFFLLLVVIAMTSLIYVQVKAYVIQRVDDFFLSEAGEFELILERTNHLDVMKVLQGEETAIGDDEVFFRLLDAQGDILASSEWRRWSLLPLTRPQSLPLKKTEFHWIQLQDHNEPTRVMFYALSPHYILQIGQTVTAEFKLLRALKTISLEIIVASFFLSLAIGLLMAKNALAGVGQISRIASSISESSMDERVPETGKGDEIDQLASTFNAMLDRISILVKGMNEINDNIAHDLRSPLTRIRGQAETTLLGPENVACHRDALGTVIEECDHLLGIINTMLAISEMDAGMSRKLFVDCDLVEIITDAHELFSTVADDKGIIIKTETPSILHVKGDKKKLQRAIANILDNAVKYTPSNGRVHISLGVDGDAASVVISDSGKGIDPDELGRIFERFYRSPTIVKNMGSGLGLSLARSIVRAHGGDIFVNSYPGKGCTFVIHLPLPPDNHR